MLKFPTAWFIYAGSNCNGSTIYLQITRQHCLLTKFGEMERKIMFKIELSAEVRHIYEPHTT